MKAAPATPRRQQGFAVLEFAGGMVTFLVALFAMFDVWRALYVWNALSGVTRTVARAAIVTGINSSALDAVKSTVILEAGGSSSAFGPDLTKAAIDVQYLDLAFNPVAALPASGNANVTTCSAAPGSPNCVRFVQVRICDPGGSNCAPLQFKPTLPLFPSFPIPSFLTILPVQGLGCIHPCT